MCTKDKKFDELKFLYIINIIDKYEKTALYYATERIKELKSVTNNYKTEELLSTYGALTTQLWKKVGPLKLTNPEYKNEIDFYFDCDKYYYNSYNNETNKIVTKQMIDTKNAVNFDILDFGNIKFMLDINTGLFKCELQTQKDSKVEKIKPVLKSSKTNIPEFNNDYLVYNEEYLSDGQTFIKIQLQNTEISLKPPSRENIGENIDLVNLINILNIFTDNEKLVLLDKKKNDLKTEEMKNLNAYERFVFIQLLCFFYGKVRSIIHKTDTRIENRLKENNKINYTKIFQLLYFMYVNAKDKVDVNVKSISMLDKFVPIDIFPEKIKTELLKKKKNKKKN